MLAVLVLDLEDVVDVRDLVATQIQNAQVLLEMQGLEGKLGELVGREIEGQQLNLTEVVLVVLVQVEDDLVQVLDVVPLQRDVLEPLGQVRRLEDVQITSF